MVGREVGRVVGGVTTEADDAGDGGGPLLVESAGDDGDPAVVSSAVDGVVGSGVVGGGVTEATTVTTTVTGTTTATGSVRAPAQALRPTRSVSNAAAHRLAPRAIVAIQYVGATVGGHKDRAALEVLCRPSRAPLNVARIAQPIVH